MKKKTAATTAAAAAAAAAAAMVQAMQLNELTIYSKAAARGRRSALALKKNCQSNSSVVINICRGSNNSIISFS